MIDDVKNDPRHYHKIDELAEFYHPLPLGSASHITWQADGCVSRFSTRQADAHYTEEDVLLLLKPWRPLPSLPCKTICLRSNAASSQDESRDLDRLKNEFIAITSHELRTPLGLILGHSTFLRELVGSEYHEQVDAIIRSASKLKEIIESLSSVDNYQTGGASLRSRKVSSHALSKMFLLRFVIWRRRKVSRSKWK